MSRAAEQLVGLSEPADAEDSAGYAHLHSHYPDISGNEGGQRTGDALLFAKALLDTGEYQVVLYPSAWLVVRCQALHRNEGPFAIRCN